MIQKKRDEEFERIISDLVSNSTVQEMDKYRQHYNTSCLEHCKNVAYYNYKICKRLGLDYVSATRAGMLHDLFLYDWRKPQPGRKRLHAFHHPRVALTNARKIFELNKKEEDMILKHMWPLTVVLPKYKESYVITISDKICVLQETGKHYHNILTSKNSFRHAYIFFSLLIIPII